MMQTAYHWLERGVLFQNISSPYPKITRNKEHIARNGSPVLRPRDSWYSNNMQQQNNLIRCLIQVSQPTPNSVREKHAWYSFMCRLKPMVFLPISSGVNTLVTLVSRWTWTSKQTNECLSPGYGIYCNGSWPTPNLPVHQDVHEVSTPWNQWFCQFAQLLGNQFCSLAGPGNFLSALLRKRGSFWPRPPTALVTSRRHSWPLIECKRCSRRGRRQNRRLGPHCDVTGMMSFQVI
jgi:hypothetical protein